MKIYCFGNQDIEEDKLALELADELVVKGFEFVKCTSPDFLQTEDKVLVILDVVKDIDDVIIINDIDKIKQYNIVSTHDLDLGFHLKLLKEMGELQKLTIIGLPPRMDKEKAKQKIRILLKELFPIHF
ncbi:hypothetical protein KY325_02720 [Candidatus Woesearchaeota archaeon]|nr:hypothetical protein [Candidatus Woesearchaeota archaeon]MBW3018045.1 hypothetical protein [Candidatus Woesearchaeota archaeon]